MKCKYCQSEVDAKAKICPHCGKKIKGLPKWLIAIIIVFVIGIIVASNDSENTAKEGKVSTNQSTEQKQEKFTYEITNQYNDTFSYYIEGNVKNNRNKNYSYVQIEFVCYDAAGNNLGTAMDNTNNLLANQTWKFKAIFLGTHEEVDHCDYHEITSW